MPNKLPRRSVHSTCGKPRRSSKSVKPSANGSKPGPPNGNRGHAMGLLKTLCRRHLDISKKCHTSTPSRGRSSSGFDAKQFRVSLKAKAPWNPTTGPEDVAYIRAMGHIPGHPLEDGQFIEVRKGLPSALVIDKIRAERRPPHGG